MHAGCSKADYPRLTSKTQSKLLNIVDEFKNISSEISSGSKKAFFFGVLKLTDIQKFKFNPGLAII